MDNDTRTKIYKAQRVQGKIFLKRRYIGTKGGKNCLYEIFHENVFQN